MIFMNNDETEILIKLRQILEFLEAQHYSDGQLCDAVCEQNRLLERIANALEKEPSKIRKRENNYKWWLNNRIDF